MNTPNKITLNETAERYLAELDIKPSSRETYKRSLIELIRYTESIGNPAPARAVLLGYKQSLIDAGKSENTTNTYLIVANSYYRWLAEEGIIPAYIPPIKGIKMHAGMRHDALTPAHAYGMLNIDAPLGEIGGELAKARDEAIISLGIHTGLREISISTLTCGDLRNRGDKTVLYYLSKGHYSKDAYVIVIPEVANKIYDYLAMRGPVIRDDAPLFASTSNRNKNGPMSTHAIAKVIRKYLRLNGIKNPRITPHSAIRHTAGTLAILGNASVKECANMLGHVDSTTTERYYLHDLTRMQGIGEEAIASVLRHTAEEIALNEGNHTPALTEVLE